MAYNDDHIGALRLVLQERYDWFGQPSLFIGVVAQTVVYLGKNQYRIWINFIEFNTLKAKVYVVDMNKYRIIDDYS